VPAAVARWNTRPPPPARRSPNSEHSAAARKAALLRAFQVSNMVHFAGHGEFIAPLPSACGLVVPDRDPSVDGQLLGIMDLPERLMPWHVSLSACFTGDVLALDDGRTVSLPEALCEMGADYVAANLWRVQDSIQPQLFAQYYAELDRSSPIQAAAHVRRALRQQKIAPGMAMDGVHPENWAPFVVTCAPAAFVRD
jgi:CHAT domain-containing protein